MECRGGGEWRGALAISQEWDRERARKEQEHEEEEEEEEKEERERERAMIQMPIAAWTSDPWEKHWRILQQMQLHFSLFTIHQVTLDSLDSLFLHLDYICTWTNAFTQFAGGEIAAVPQEQV